MALIGTSTLVFPKLDAENNSAKRKHVCHICSRAFKRSEHCIRHTRGHTQEKPFGCRVCRRRYSRRDLLVRHERTLHTPEALATAISKLKGGKADVLPANERSPKRLRTAAAGSDVEEVDELDIPNAEGDDDNPIGVVSANMFLSTTDPGFQMTSTTVEVPNLPIETASDSLQHPSEFTIEPAELESMRTFPASVPLPELDGDLEFLDFFDPFLGMTPKQAEAFTLPTLDATGWSPLENFSGSSQASLHDYGLQQGQSLLNIESPNKEDALNHPVATESHLQQQSAPWKTPKLNKAYAQAELVRLVQDSQQPSAKPQKSPAVVFSDAMRTNVLKDLNERLPGQLEKFRLPPAAALQKCLQTYFDAFHIHLPIFHLHTMDLEHTPAPLVLAICAIGARYRLERKISASLYIKADQALTAAVSDRGAHLHKKPRLLEDWIRPRLTPAQSVAESLWKSQTRLLLCMLVCFSGDTEAISRAILQLPDFILVSLLQ
jgi:hypothetical protein